MRPATMILAGIGLSVLGVALPLLMLIHILDVHILPELFFVHGVHGRPDAGH